MTKRWQHSRRREEEKRKLSHEQKLNQLINRMSDLGWDEPANAETRLFVKMLYPDLYEHIDKAVNDRKAKKDVE